MIELINHGVHYANGAIIDGSEAEQTAALQAQGLQDKGRDGTIAYSILKSHNKSGSDSALPGKGTGPSVQSPKLFCPEASQEERSFGSTAGALTLYLQEQCRYFDWARYTGT